VLQVPRVTVGIPVYNGGALLTRTVESLLGQTFADFELLISDNASEDDTPEICREYVKKDSRVRYFRQETNKGAAANYNFLLDQARAEFFCFAPHDDYWYPRWLEGAVAVLDAVADASLVMGTIEFVDRSNTVFAVVSPPWGLDQPESAQRIKHYLETEITDHIMYGVFRTAALKGFRFGYQQTAPEKAFIFALIMAGKIANSQVMRMKNHVSFKKPQELYEFFQIKKWHWAVVRTHLACLLSLSRGVKAHVALVNITRYCFDVINRRLLGRKRSRYQHIVFLGNPVQ
jgi:glycosyltransferase involved in cell wall biosynthesis